MRRFEPFLMPGTPELKVAQVIGSFPPATYHGGPIASTFGLCRALVDAGCEVRVLTTDANGPSARIHVPLDQPTSLDGMTVRYCRSLTDRPLSPSLLHHLPTTVQWADVVHVTGVYEHHTIPSLAACRWWGRPAIWSPRGSLQRWERVRRPRAKAAWEAACRVAMPARTVLHVTASPEAEASAARLPGSDIAVIPNGIELPPSVARHARTEELNILFLGRLDPIKALDRLVEASRNLDDVPHRMTIAGHGDRDYEARLRGLVDRLGLTSRITFAGHVAGMEKTRLLAHADLLVLPSFSENFGMVVAEALAHGRPVIASRGTPWQELERHDCGLWVDNAPESLAAAIRQLASRDLEAMGRRGRAWMDRDFSWSSIAQRMLAVYRSARSARPLPPTLAHPPTEVRP